MTVFPDRRAVGALTAAVDSVAVTAGPFVIGATRIVVGILFACHGVASLFGIWGRPVAVGFATWPGFYAAAIQLICGVLVAAGVGTRVAALLGSGSMAYAYFTVHQETGLLPITNGGEPAAMFCWTLLLLAAVGPGAMQIGRLPARRLPAVAASTASADRVAA